MVLKESSDFIFVSTYGRNPIPERIESLCEYFLRDSGTDLTEKNAVTEIFETSEVAND